MSERKSIMSKKGGQKSKWARMAEAEDTDEIVEEVYKKSQPTGGPEDDLREAFAHKPDEDHDDADKLL